MADNNSALALAILGMNKGGGGGGSEPAAYIKSASVANNELTLTRKDDTTLTYSPDVDKAYVDSAIEDVEAEIPSLDGYATEQYVNNHHDSTKQDTLTAGTNISIVNNVISASGGGSEPAAYLKSASVSNNTLTLVNKDNTTVEFTPQGGGSAEGAVRYDQAQSLTEAQQMQARANQGLPYTEKETTLYYSANTYVSGYGSVTLYGAPQASSVLNKIAVGDKFTVKFASYGETILTVSRIGTDRFYVTGDGIISSLEEQQEYNTNFIIKMNGGAIAPDDNITVEVYWKDDVVKTKLPKDMLDLGELNKLIINDSSYSTGFNLSLGNTAIPDRTFYFAPSTSYEKSLPLSSIILCPSNDDIFYGDTDIIAIGSSLSTSARNYGGMLIGHNLNTASQTNFGLITGYYNDEIFTNGYLGEYKYNTTYSIGDVVSDSNCYLYSSLQNDNIGHSPSSGSSDEWWHYEGNYIRTTSPYTLLFAIGNGNITNRSNAFTVDWSGNGDFAGTVASNGSDYAEYFEWKDGNPDNEDRVGYLVTLDEDKLVLADADDDIIGIVAATPTVLGDTAHMFWHGKYLRDDFGRIIKGEVEHTGERQKIDPETGEPMYDEDGNPIMEEYTYTVVEPLINPEYDPDKQYKNRHARPEWTVVGLLGKLYVRDDGTAVVNGYVTANNGIATKSAEKTNLRVLERVNDHIIRVLVK